MVNIQDSTYWRQDHDFFFANEADRENVAENDGVPFDDPIFLEVDVKQHKYIFGLDDEGDFTSILEILVGADVDFLDFEGEVVNVGLGDDWFLGIGLSIDFVLVAE